MRVSTSAVYMLTMMPAERVTAKPRIGPEPKKKRIRPISSVVMLESKIARKARSYPAATAARADLPALNSSRMRSKISTLASTAMPTVSTMPAMPGMVSTGSEMMLLPEEPPSRTKVPSRPATRIMPAGSRIMLASRATFASRPQ